jgi:hypothetical protein
MFMTPPIHAMLRQIWRRRVLKLHPALAVLLWAASGGIAFAGGMDNDINRVHGDLQGMLHCEWQGSTPYTICPSTQVRDVVGVNVDKATNRPQTIEFHPLLTIQPADSVQNKLSHDTILKIVHYFLPDWKEQDAWVTSALMAATDDDNAEHSIKVGDATVYIRSLDVEDGEGSYAMVVITKDASIDHWTIDKTSIMR